MLGFVRVAPLIHDPAVDGSVSLPLAVSLPVSVPPDSGRYEWECDAAAAPTCSAVCVWPLAAYGSAGMSAATSLRNVAPPLLPFGAASTVFAALDTPES